MTKLEVIKANKEQYAEITAKIPDMDGIEKVVAENLILEWCKGNNWMGGLSDSKAQKILDRLVAIGYDEIDLLDEFDRQISQG